MPTKKSLVAVKSKKSNSVSSVVARKASPSKGQAFAKVDHKLRPSQTRLRPGLSKTATTESTEKKHETTEKNSARSAKSSVSSVVTRKTVSAEVYNISGKREGSVTLAKEIFGAKPNKKLLAHALHVYFVNSTTHFGSTKTRSEVRGGGAKPWRQKGTGRARAGSRRSPLWVGGAKALGPKYRKTILTLPKKMKSQALVSALSAKAQDGNIKVVSGLEKISPKTKIVANFLQKTTGTSSTLFVISEKNKNVALATRNLQTVSLEPAANLNSYEVVKRRNIFISKEALLALANRFSQKSNKETA